MIASATGGDVIVLVEVLADPSGRCSDYCGQEDDVTLCSLEGGRRADADLAGGADFRCDGRVDLVLKEFDLSVSLQHDDAKCSARIRGIVQAFEQLRHDAFRLYRVADCLCISLLVGTLDVSDAQWLQIGSLPLAQRNDLTGPAVELLLRPVDDFRHASEVFRKRTTASLPDRAERRPYR